MKARLLNIILLLALGGLAVIWFQQWQAADALKKENAALRAEAARIADLEAEIAKLKQQNAALLAQLPNANELARLRADATALRRTQQDLARAQAAAEAANAAAARAAAPPMTTNVPPPLAFRGSVRISGSGETFITGGWAMENGKRGYAFVTPVVGPNGDVTIEAKLLAVPESAVAATGLSGFMTQERNADRYGLTDPAMTKSVLEAIQNVQGVEILSAPRVITSSGASAAIAIGDTTKPGGAIRLDFNPKLAADGKGLDLQMDLQLPSGPAR